MDHIDTDGKGKSTVEKTGMQALVQQRTLQSHKKSFFLIIYTCWTAQFCPSYAAG